jgi:hypothetical protein
MAEMTTKRIFLEEKSGYSPDDRSQGRASRAAQRSKTLDTGHPGKRFQLSAAASAAAAYEKKGPKSFMESERGGWDSWN